MGDPKFGLALIIFIPYYTTPDMVISFLELFLSTITLTDFYRWLAKNKQ